MSVKWSAIRNFVIKELGADHSGHNHQHAFRVAHNADIILNRENGNRKITMAAAYLHDCVDQKLFSNPTPQIDKIRILLKETNYSDNEIETVINIIQNISYNNGNYSELTLHEAMITRDADRLDAIGAIGIVRAIEYGTIKRRSFYSANNKDPNTTLAHFYNKLLKLEGLMLTATGKELAAERHQFLLLFISQFYKELDGQI